MSTSLVFMPYSFMSPHVDVTLAYAQREISLGKKVIILTCGPGLFEKNKACGFNVYSTASKCRYCERRTSEALNSLEGSYELVDMNAFEVKDDFNNIKKQINLSSTLNDIKKLKYHGHDLGYAIVSSLVSKYRTSTYCNKKKLILISLAKAFIQAYHSVQNIADKNIVTEAFVFNGRYELTRGFFRACRELNIRCNILEVSQVGHKTLSYENALPLDIPYTKDLIEELWSKTNDEQKKLAVEFYEKKAKGVAIHDKIYTQDQKQDLLPKDWNPTKKNIVIFGSSSDEFFAIGPEWEFPFYKDQFDGVINIVRSLQGNDSIHIYYRMHPNLSLLVGDELKHELTLGQKYKNLTVIPPEDKVSTYAILEKSNKVITFGSSVGIEAAYWKKESILAGMSMYAHLGSTRNPTTHEELISMVMLDDCIDVDITGALKYSNFLLQRGEYVDNLYVSPTTVSFKGKKQLSNTSFERVFFKIINVFEVMKDWNTFALAFRDVIPLKLKEMLISIIRR